MGQSNTKSRQKPKTGAKSVKRPKPKAAPNPFVNDPDHMGEMTVRQLVELVSTAEFPKGLDTRICIGDVEGNLGVNAAIMVTANQPGDIVLSIDEHGGDLGYCDALLTAGADNE